MKPNVLRSELWEDKKTLDMILDRRIFKELHAVFLDMMMPSSLFQMSELAIMNEVGYEVAWLCYHSGYGDDVDMKQFVKGLHANTIDKKYADIVISLVHAVVRVVNFPPLNVSRHTKQRLKSLNMKSWCGSVINGFIEKMDKEGHIFEESFKPHMALPVAVAKTEAHDERAVYEAAASAAYVVTKERGRTFTLDEIVWYAKNNLTVETALPIQAMLYSLMVDDSTKEEREKVFSIITYIKQNSLCNNFNTFEKPVGVVIMSGVDSMIKENIEIITNNKSNG